MMAVPDMRQLGSTGLNRAGGQVYEEYLNELSGVRWFRTVREMENDAVVGAILYAIEMLVRQVPWRVEAVSDAAEDRAAAEFLRECIGDMSQGWNDTLSEILTMLSYGWSYLETNYKLRRGLVSTGSTGAQKPSSKYNDGRVGWRSWSIRAQDTLWEWEWDDEGGIQAMWQSAPPDYKMVRIPIDKALLFRTSTHKGNPEGKSILRTAYRSWYFKKNIENVEAIGIERDLAGLPVGYVPPEVLSPEASADQQAVLSAIKQIIVNIRRDEQEGVVWPLAYDEKGNPLYDLKLLSTGGQRQFDTDKIINRYDSRIAMTVLADFVLTGHESTGSFALNQSKTDLFMLALGGYLDMIAGRMRDGTPQGVVNQYAIPRLFQYNDFRIDQTPVLVHGDIESVNLKELGEYITALSGAGMMLFPDAALENYLRAQANLPALADEESVS